MSASKSRRKADPEDDIARPIPTWLGLHPHIIPGLSHLHIFHIFIVDSVAPAVSKSVSISFERRSEPRNNDEGLLPPPRCPRAVSRWPRSNARKWRASTRNCSISF